MTIISHFGHKHAVPTRPPKNSCCSLGVLTSRPLHLTEVPVKRRRGKKTPSMASPTEMGSGSHGNATVVESASESASSSSRSLSLYVLVPLLSSCISTIGLSASCHGRNFFFYPQMSSYSLTTIIYQIDYPSARPVMRETDCTVD